MEEYGGKTSHAESKVSGSEKTTDPQMDNGKINRRNAFPNWKDLFVFIGIFLIANLIAGFFGFICSVTLGENSGFTTFISYLSSFLLTIVFSVKYIKRKTGTKEKVVSFSFKGFDPNMILWGAILIFATSVVIEPLINLFPPEWYEIVGQQATNGAWAMTTAVVLASVCEETLFRGIIQKSITQKYGPWSGILSAAAIFGIIHGIPQQIVSGFCLGIVFGFVYYKTNSLISVIVLHGINNTIALFTSLLVEENTMKTLRESIGNDSIYKTVYGISLLLFVLFFIQMSTTISKRKKKIIE